MSKRKMKYVLLYVNLFIALILQTTLICRLSFFGVVPSLILVAVICFALVNDYVDSAVFAGVAGLLMDIAGGRIIGFNSLLMLYLSLGMVYVGQEFFRENIKAAVILVAAGTLVYEMVYFIFTFAIFGGSHFFYMMWRVVMVECLYNALLAIPVYLYVDKFFKIRGGRSLLD